MNYYALSALVTFLTTIILGIVIFAINPRRKIYQTYALANFSVAFWSFFYFFWQISSNHESAFKSLKLLMFGATFMPIFLLHFIFSYLEIESRKRIFLSIVYIIGVAFLFGINNNLLFNNMSSKADFPFWPNAEVIMPLYLIFFFGIITYAMVLLYKNYSASTGIKRTKTGYLFLALSIAILAGSPNYALWYDIPIRPVLNPLFAVYTVIIAIAITKHRLMDISVVISRTFAWLLTVLFLGSIYTGLLMFYRTYISIQIDLLFWAWTILYGIFVGQTFQKIRVFLQTTADKTFIKGWYDYRKVQRKISSELRKAISFEDTIKTVRDSLDEELDISKIIILLPDKEARAFTGGELEISAEDALIKRIRDKKDIVLKGDYHALQAELRIPCFSDGELSALILLGKKRSEESYNEQDIDILRTLSDEISDTLLRIRPYEEVKEDLSIEKEKVEIA